MDILKSIVPNSDQLNADDLILGNKTIKITGVVLVDNEKQPLKIFFENDNKKPYIPSKGMRRVLVNLWGSESENFIGKSLTLYRDETVRFGGEQVGGIRISHASHIESDLQVLETVAKGKRRPILIKQLILESVISDTLILAKFNFVNTLDELSILWDTLEKEEKKMPRVLAKKEELKSKLKQNE